MNYKKVKNKGEFVSERCDEKIKSAKNRQL